MSKQSDESFRLIIDYLQTRGHTKAASVLASELSGTSTRGAADKAVSFSEFVQSNSYKKHQLEKLVNDPAGWEAGYESLRGFVDNSLDIHRPELLPLLLPIFVHSYLDLIMANYREAADSFLEKFSPDHNVLHPGLVRALSAIRLPEHIAESEEALRWQKNRYRVVLSERGWGLVLGWLQGGQTIAFDTPHATNAKGRDRVLAILNEHVRVDRYEGAPRADVAADESNLLSAEQSAADNTEVKLGQAPLEPKLEREVARVLRKEDAAPIPPDNTGLSLPYSTELLPYPSTVRTIDIMREVEKCREARKRVRLGPEAYKNDPSAGTLTVPNAPDVPGVAKPSVCLFTIHDAGESLIKLAFSEDCSLLAGGFADSSIKLWSLSGDALPLLRREYPIDRVTDRKSFERHMLTTTDSTSIKLVGHAGPVYSVAFDPVHGPAGAPQTLLSASQDGTVRLWGLGLYTTLAVFRDHRDAVWDVSWAPRGVYFATASRDKTARLWSADRASALRIFVGHLSDVSCVRFHPNMLYLATGSADRTCRLWDVQRGVCVRIFTGHRGGVSAVAISPNGRLLASAADDESIIVWDLTSGKALRTLKGHEGPIYSIVFSQESTVLLSASADQTVRVWDVDVSAGADKGSTVATTSVPAVKPAEPDYELATLATKKTPVVDLFMTYRNVCLAGGYFQN